jgi:formylglycine-generating enzyme required for sulfatase activity
MNAWRESRLKKFCFHVCLVTVFVLALFSFFAGCEKPPRVTISQAEEVIAENIVRSGVSAVAFSDDGDYLLTGAVDGSVDVWALYSGARTGGFTAGSEAVLAAAFSPGSSVLAAAAGNGIRVWDRGSGRLLQSIETDTTLALRFDSGGKELFSLSEKGVIRAWNIETGEMARSVASGIREMDAAALGSGGGSVLYAAAGEVILANAEDGGELARYSGLAGGALALAISPDDKYAAAVNGEGTIKVWDIYAGTEIKSLQGAGNERALALDGGHSRLLSGGEDGVTRLWDLQKGAEIARYVIFFEEDGREWICVVPELYFNSSARGSSLYLIRDGDNVFSLLQFSERFFRPDRVSKSIRGELKNAEKSAMDKEIENAKGLPYLEILNQDSMTTMETVVPIQVKITENKGGIGSIAVYNGGQIDRLFSLEEGIVKGPYKEGGKNTYELALPVRLRSGVTNKIGITAFNQDNGPKTRMCYLEVLSRRESVAGERKPVLHVLLAGIDTYKNPNLAPTLSYSKKDAEAIGELFLKQKDGALYEDVKVYRIYDEKVTKEGFASIFDDIQGQAEEQDAFVLCYVGHGYTDENGGFFIVPYDYAKNVTGNYIARHDIIGNILKIPAKNTLILLDTCRSGAILEMESEFGLMLKELGQRAILVAAAGDQSAYESVDLDHGVFTASLLDGLSREAATHEERYIGVAEIAVHIRRDVPDKLMLVSAGSSRGLESTVVEIQEPLALTPDRDFYIVDRILEPGTLTISAKSPGSVMIGERIDAIDANTPLVYSLKEGEYEVNIAYADSYNEVMPVTVYNRMPVSLNLIYEVAEPGTLSIYSKAEGVVSIAETREHSIPVSSSRPVIRSLDEGRYTITIEYNDGYRETTIRNIGNKSSATVSFEYRPKEYPGFTLIKGGTFTMGSPAAEADRQDRETQHTVTVRSFYMGTYEVTQTDYSRVMGGNPSAAKGNNLPVEKVQWFDAIKYCNALSQREGLVPAYRMQGDQVTWNRNADGYRLPTEAEWEYAYRAGSASVYPWGNSVNPSIANYDLKKSTPVGSYRANRFGLYDMAGNVWEWCWDWDGSYDNGSVVDPAGPETGTRKITRGGGFNAQGVQNLRAAYRGRDYPARSDNDVGFRIVRPVILP